MTEFLKLSIDYIEGKTDSETFEKILENDSDYREWLQSIVPATKTMYIYDSTINNVVQQPYSVSTMLHECESIQVGGPKGSPEYRYIVHKEITDLIAEAFPELNLIPDQSLKDDYDLCMDACPMYIGGVEIAKANIIGKILATVPKNLSKTNRKKEARAKILQTFHVDGKKYPRWNQEPEWPVYNGKPMKFVRSEKVNFEVKIHYFIDEKTGVERSIEDAL